MAVHGLQASLDEPFLILGVAGGEGPAHNDEIYLVGVVADLLQLCEPALHLVVGVEAVHGGPSGRGLLTGVRLGGVVGDPSGTVGALAVGTRIGGGHHGDHGDAAGGAHGLLDEQRQEPLLLLLGDKCQHLGIGGYLLGAVPGAELHLETLKVLAVRDLS